MSSRFSKFRTVSRTRAAACADRLPCTQVKYFASRSCRLLIRRGRVTLGRVALSVLQVDREAFFGPSFYRASRRRDDAKPAHQRLDILRSHPFVGHLPKPHPAIEKGHGQAVL